MLNADRRAFEPQIALKMEEAQVLCGRAFDTSPGALRTLREGLGLSREALAVKLGVSAQTLFRWETGRSRPRAAAAKRIDALRRKARSKRRAG